LLACYSIAALTAGVGRCQSCRHHSHSPRPRRSGRRVSPRRLGGVVRPSRRPRALCRALLSAYLPHPSAPPGPHARTRTAPHLELHHAPFMARHLHVLPTTACHTHTLLRPALCCVLEQLPLAETRLGEASRCVFRPLFTPTVGQFPRSTGPVPQSSAPNPLRPHQGGETMDAPCTLIWHPSPRSRLPESLPLGYLVSRGIIRWQRVSPHSTDTDRQVYWRAWRDAASCARTRGLEQRDPAPWGETGWSSS